jgi:hypothetical protein
VHERRLSRTVPGVHAAIEGFDKVLLKQFKKAGGNLYDGGFRMDVTAPLERNSGSGANDLSFATPH